MPRTRLSFLFGCTYCALGRGVLHKTQYVPGRLHGWYSLSAEVIHHPVGAYCIRPRMYPICKWVDPKEWADLYIRPIRIQSISIYVCPYATDVLWGVSFVSLLGYMIIFPKMRRYLRRQRDSSFVFQFLITYAVGVCPRSTHANPSRRLT